MAKEAFMHIKKAEAQAEEIIKSAQEEALEIIRLAEEEAAGAFAQLSETCNRQHSEKKQELKKEIEDMNAAFSKETNVLCDELRQKLSQNKPDAVDAVIQMIRTASNDIK